MDFATRTSCSSSGRAATHSGTQSDRNPKPAVSRLKRLLSLNNPNTVVTAIFGKKAPSIITQMAPACNPEIKLIHKAIKAEFIHWIYIEYIPFSDSFSIIHSAECMFNLYHISSSHSFSAYKRLKGQLMRPRCVKLQAAEEARWTSSEHSSVPDFIDWHHQIIFTTCPSINRDFNSVSEWKRVL